MCLVLTDSQREQNVTTLKKGAYSWISLERIDKTKQCHVDDKYGEELHTGYTIRMLLHGFTEFLGKIQSLVIFPFVVHKIVS